MSAAVAPGPPVAPRATRRCLALTLGVGMLLTIVSAGLTTTSRLHFGGWQWLMVGVAVAAIALALPVHRSALASLRSGRVRADVLGSVGLAVALGASVHAAAVGSTTAAAVGVVVPAALLTLVVRWIGDESFIGTPAWLVVLLGAAGVLAGLAWAVTTSPGQGLHVAAAVLVAAGPAALLAAGPSALRAARARVARHGVTLPTPSALPRVAAADVVVLEKDGTVTTGGLRVRSVDPVEPDHDRNLRWFAGALEHEHDDPIAHAIARLSARGRVTEVRRHTGRGVAGRVDRHPVRVGDPSWLGTTAPDGIWTTVGVEVDARVIGTITVADDVRTDAATAVQRLDGLGIDVVMCSADIAERTREVARTVGIDDVRVSTGPPAQRELVQELEGSGRTPLHLDAGCAVQADLGLADLDVSRVERAIRAARSALTAGRRARTAAVTISVVSAAAAAAGLLGPGLASIAATAGLAVTLAAASAD